MSDLLTINQLCAGYGRTEILKGISLAMAGGEILALVGESGCGKTTLLRSIMGLLGPGGHISAGGISFGGLNLLSLSQEQMRRVRGRRLTMVFQNSKDALNPTRTIGAQFLETVRSHRRISRKEALAEISDLLLCLNLDNPERILRSYPFELSGGMNQRAAIALAMVMRPELLLADEPTSALDAVAQAQAAAEMLNLRRRLKAGIILITHNLGLAAHMADRIGVMYAGQLVEYGSKDAVLSGPLHPYTKALMAGVPRLDGAMPGEIHGSPPPPGYRPPGCGFAERCPAKGPACLKPQILTGSTRLHLVACGQAHSCQALQ